MKSDVALPPIFADNNVCLLDAHALQTTRVPPRQVGSTSSWGLSTQLSAMTSRVLSLRLDGTVHSFEEARNVVRYVDNPSRSPTALTGRPLPRVAVTMVGDRPTLNSPPQPATPRFTLGVLEDVSPRMISIRRICARHTLTLLMIDDTTGKVIGVIGDAIAWSLDGLDVQLVTDYDNNEVARI